MKAFQKWSPFIVLTALTLVFLGMHYGDMLLAPNDFMFSQDGDGLKNYFTYAYHIRHSQSWVNFEGMNYPCGEHSLYTDSHPILTYVFKPLSTWFPVLANQPIGVLNLILLSGFLFTSWSVYALLRELNLKPWYAVLFSLGICLMVPQLGRIGGHFALSYSWAIPFSWYLFLRHKRLGGRLNFWLLFLNGLFWLFIHAYLGVIALAFLSALYVTDVWQYFNGKIESANRLTARLYATVLPLFLFFLFAVMTDRHSDRTDNPTGYFLYYGEMDNIVVPSYGPVRPFWDWLTANQVNLQGEANAYIGLANVLLLFFLFFLGLSALVVKGNRSRLKLFFGHSSLNQALIAATLVMLLAFGLPFVQFPDLLDYFPILKQFRAIGRFTWPFYFAFTAFGAFQFQRLIENRIEHKQKVVAWLMIVLVGLVPFYEAYGYQTMYARGIHGKENLFNADQLKEPFSSALLKIDPDRYQAIIPLPFFHHGSEVFERPRIEQVVQHTLVLSYHTGIPTVGANLTRSSISESKKIIQLVTPNYYPKPIQEEMDSTKPFLIALTDLELTPYEEQLLSRAQLLSPMKDGLELYEISPQELFRDERQAVVNDFMKKKPALHPRGSFFLSDSSAFFYFNDFESTPSDTSFSGKGAYASIKKGEHNLDEFPAGTFQAEKEYHLSLWMFNDEPDALNQRFFVKVLSYDPATNQFEEYTRIFAERAETILGKWSLVEGTFVVDRPGKTTIIQTDGNDLSKAALHVDDLMVRELGVEVYWYEEDRGLSWDNQRVFLP